MNGIENPYIFYPIATLLLVFAGLAMKFENIFYSLLSAMAVFLIAGVLFFVLGSEYNGVIQVLIYGIAVPVILGLAVMFTNMKRDNEENVSYRLKLVMFFVCGMFIIAVSALFLSNGFFVAEETCGNSFEVIQAFSNGIFVKYVWAFELVSLILTVTAIGLTLFKRREIK